MPPQKRDTLYSLPSDTLYRRMMHESDNFIAEQLLILASSTQFDHLSSRKVRELVLNKNLSDLRQPPRWVDGSGLSRYNLFTPESMVQVLTKLQRSIPKKRLFKIFPLAGFSGTVENWPSAVSTPYLFVKSGSMGNTYCMSGYLITKSGKTLIFSFMNNHFSRPITEVKKRMQLMFDNIYETY